MSNSLQPHELQHIRLPCPSLSPGVCPNSCPLSQWCYLTLSSSARSLLLLPYFFQHRVFSSESAFRIRWPKYWSFSYSISPSKNIWGWFPFRLIELISLQFKGLLRVFFSSTIQKHLFFGIQSSLWSNSHIHTSVLGKTQLWLYETSSAKQCFCFLICCLGLS